MKNPAPETHQFYHSENYRPEESVGYLMRTILSHVSHAIDVQLAPTGLTSAQWIPMFKLYMGHATTAAELARVCSLDAGATTRMLDRMEAKGLCERKRSEEDRRVVQLALTDAGNEAAAGIPAILSTVQNAYLAGFSQGEFDTLKSMLRRIVSNAQALNNEASPTDPSKTTP